KIRELLEHSPLRANIVKSSNAPVWIPLNGKQYLVLTCPNCLRSFSLPTPNDLETRLTRTSRCEFCDVEVPYILDAEAIGNARRSRPVRLVRLLIVQIFIQRNFEIHQIISRRIAHTRQVKPRARQRIGNV